MTPVLVDTGPLVALIRSNDVNYERCVRPDSGRLASQAGFAQTT